MAARLVHLVRVSVPGPYPGGYLGHYWLGLVVNERGEFHGHATPILEPGYHPSDEATLIAETMCMVGDMQFEMWRDNDEWDARFEAEDAAREAYDLALVAGF